MFVVVQFPIADGRVLAQSSGKLDCPDWEAASLPGILAHRGFVRGFGRLAYRRNEVSPDWADEAIFAHARRAIRLPTLQRRHFQGDQSGSWIVNCQFRRLFCDGAATIRLEIGFDVRLARDERGLATIDEVVRRLAVLPVAISGNWAGGSMKDLVTLGPYIAHRYAASSTQKGAKATTTLVACGDPIVVVETVFREQTQRPKDAVDASEAWRKPGSPWEAWRQLPDFPWQIYVAPTRTRHGPVETWYLRSAYGFPRDVRLAILRQHAQEETLDRMLSWIANGALNYSPRTPEGEALERYVNKATYIVNRRNYRGVNCDELRSALDKVTAARRSNVETRRRERLDGMKRQIREKAELFLAEREDRKPNFNITARELHMGDTIFSGNFYGPVAGTVYAEKMKDSFNSFASQQPNEEVRDLVAKLHEQVADLVGRLKDTSPEDADEVTDVLADFTQEAGKTKPNKIRLRSLAGGLVESAKKVAELAVPVAGAVTAVLKMFGIAAL